MNLNSGELLVVIIISLIGIQVARYNFYYFYSTVQYPLFPNTFNWIRPYYRKVLTIKYAWHYLEWEDPGDVQLLSSETADNSDGYKSFSKVIIILF